jgi:hypothetical protein
MTDTPQPIAEIDGVPQYAQATMADGAIIIAETPPEIAAEPEARPPTSESLITPEAVAAYEREYGPVPPGGNEPEGPEPSATPYELGLTEDPTAGWDDPGLVGPADREVQAG